MMIKSTTFKNCVKNWVLIYYLPCLFHKVLNFGKSLKPVRLIMAKSEQDPKIVIYLFDLSLEFEKN